MDVTYNRQQIVQGRLVNTHLSGLWGNAGGLQPTRLDGLRPSDCCRADCVALALRGAESVCELPTAEFLGAVDVLTRDFEAAFVEDPEIIPDPTWPASYATNQVALFPDSVTASAAIAAWEVATRDCAPGPSIISDPDSFRISDLPTGSTWGVAARATNDACPECLRFEFLGFTAMASAVTTVGFSLTGQDANYEGDPVAESLEAALARLP